MILVSTNKEDSALSPLPTLVVAQLFKTLPMGKTWLSQFNANANLYIYIYTPSKVGAEVDTSTTNIVFGEKKTPHKSISCSISPICDQEDT